MIIKSILHNIFIALIFICLTAGAAYAQTTTFTYQGKLTDTGTPQTNYQMEFKLFGSPSGADQIGGAITNPNVTVNQGVFTVNLDFGAAAFPGADRFLQISVRRSAAESFVTLNPRQQITSSPYSIRTLSAAQADVALDSNKLGGVIASEYVTTSSVGSSFIRNMTTQQTANFNISGNGIVGGNLGIGVTPSAGIKLDVNGDALIRTSGGNIQFGTPGGETGMTIIGTNRADIRFNDSTLKLFAGPGVGPPANGIAVNTTGGATVTGFNSDSAVITARRTDGSSFVLIDSTIKTQSSVLGFRKSNLNRWLMLTNGTSESGGNTGSDFQLDAYNDAGGGIANYFFIKRSNGNIGIGTNVPQTRLAINGGPGWTSAGWTGSLSMGNASALGWEANSSGQRFGIGQSNGGLYFFRTNSAFGTTGSPASYDLQITDTGNVTQPRDKNGLVKAMLYVDPFLPASQYIVRCYNGLTNSSSGNCGFTVTRIGAGQYLINFGFQVNDRFFSLTLEFSANDLDHGSVRYANTNEAVVNISDITGDNRDAKFFLFVY